MAVLLVMGGTGTVGLITRPNGICICTTCGRVFAVESGWLYAGELYLLVLGTSGTPSAATRPCFNIGTRGGGTVNSLSMGRSSTSPAESGGAGGGGDRR